MKKEKHIDKDFAKRNIVWIALIFAAIIRLFLFPVRVTGVSMSPTYEDGKILTTSIFTNDKNLKRGDVVVFHEGNTDEVMIKRIIGMPGDEIVISNKGIEINGQLYEDSFTNNMKYPELGILYWKLDTGEYFVLGDNRNDSLDSRRYGKIQLAQIFAKVNTYNSKFTYSLN